MLLQHKDSDREKCVIKVQSLLITFLSFFAKKSSTEDEQVAKSELLFADYRVFHNC